MKRSFLKPRLFVTGFALCMFTSAAMSEDLVKFDATQTMMGGSACLPNTATVEAEGSSLVVTLDAHAVQLNRGGTTLAGRSACTIRIPVEVAEGYYISAVTQRVQAQVSKSGQSSGAVASVVSFFGANLSPFTIEIPTDDDRSFIDETRRDLVSSDDVCNQPGAARGHLAINLAITGQKPNRSEELIVRVSDFKLIEGEDYEVSPCPLHVGLKL